MNVDGAASGNRRVAGCGGIIRDATGFWQDGFSVNLGYTTNVVAELWGILIGLKLTWNKGIHKFLIETNSKPMHGVETKKYTRERTLQSHFAN